jgi:hypothetical protein
MTATRIIWGEDLALTVSRKLKEVQQSFYDAAENGGWVVIIGDDGKKVSVNPQQVLYLEEVKLPRRKADSPNRAARRAAPPSRQSAAAR